MIYTTVPPDAPVDQGDLIDGCVVAILPVFALDQTEYDADFEPRRVLVLTQTCDLANDKRRSRRSPKCRPLSSSWTPES